MKDLKRRQVLSHSAHGLLAAVCASFINIGRGFASTSLDLNSLLTFAKSGKAFDLPSGETKVESPLPLRLTGMDLTLAGNTDGTSALLWRKTNGERMIQPMLMLDSGSALTVRDLRLLGGDGLVAFAVTDRAPQIGKPSQAQSTSLVLENVVFEGVQVPVLLSNQGFRRKANGGIESVSVRDCAIFNGLRGLMLGDLGRYYFGDILIDGLKVSNVGRFGLYLGSTEEESAAYTRSIKLTNIDVSDLVYEAGKNCGHVVVVGRNVTMENLTLTGAKISNQDIAKESDKEGLYMKCLYADISKVRIKDTLGNQGAIVLKGIALDIDHRQPKGGHYRLQDISVVQSADSLGDMRGMWVQVGPSVVNDAVFDGLGREGIVIATARVNDVFLKNVTVQNQRARTAFSLRAQEFSNVRLRDCTVLPPHKNRYTPDKSYSCVTVESAKENGHSDRVAIEACTFSPGLSPDDAVPTVGVRYRAKQGSKHFDMKLSDCEFHCDVGVRIMNEGGLLHLTIEGCDFSRIANPERAIVYEGQKGCNSDTLNVLIRGNNKGLVNTQEGSFLSDDLLNGALLIPYTFTRLEGFAMRIDRSEANVSSSITSFNTAITEEGITFRVRGEVVTGEIISYKLTKTQWKPLKC